MNPWSAPARWSALARSVGAAVLVGGGVLAGTVRGEVNPPWVSIIDGKTLEGFVQRNGTATYRVEDGALVGRTTPGSPNSFLCTRNTYTDFELRFEVLVDDPLNSGVQFRSTSTADYRNFRVHGPQVEIATGGGAGWIYGEALDTGWLDGPTPDPVKRGAFERGEWNHYLLKVHGDHIQSWVNGVPISDFDDTKSGCRRGFLGFQVHAVGKRGPYEVRWRNIAIRDFTSRKVVFIGAGGGHGGSAHQHLAGNRMFAEALKATGLDFATAEYDGYPEDPAAFEDVDAVVFYCNGGPGHLAMPHLDELEKLMARGVGLVCLHYAVEVPKGRAGDRFLKWIGGYFETDWSVNPTWTATFGTLPAHSVARGVHPFTLKDEWYYHMRFAKDMAGVTPILSAHPPKETLNRRDGPHENNPHVREAIARGEIQHLAWAYQRPDAEGGGRGFGFTGGHWHKNWQQPDFRRVVVNGILWTAGADVPGELAR